MSIVLDNFAFYLKDNEVAVGVNIPVDDVDCLVWDEKNTLILKTENGTEYVLVNILPNVRDVLKSVSLVTVIFTQENDVKDAVDVGLVVNPSLTYDDNFNEEALSCYRSLKSSV